jgi:hypothetical protein
MADGRSNRKARIAPFLSLLEKDREVNLITLIDKAKKLEIEGFESVNWDSNIWKIKSGRLIKQAGRNVFTTSLIFNFPKKIGGNLIPTNWANLIKALVILRFHRKHQSIPNQRAFITTISYIAYESLIREQRIDQITPEILDSACQLIASLYNKSTTYNMQKAVCEFAAHCDANALCKAYFNYKFSGMKRPENVSGIGYKRLDDPNVVETKNDKLISPEVFHILGELYQNVPKNHKYRFYVLVLTLLACLGRRFSEIILLPHQLVNYDSENRAYIEYFPRKQSHGDTFTPLRRLYLPTATILIVTDALLELDKICIAPRKTAEEMQNVNGPDLTFIAHIPSDKRLYADDLKNLGINPGLLYNPGWLRMKGYSYADPDKITQQNKKPNHPFQYTTKEGVIKYCQRDFFPSFNNPIHTDQNGKKYYLKDLLLVRHRGLSSGAYSCWIATMCTASMMTTFLRYFDDLVSKYASSNIKANFSSHHFRHTLNTLLDEGGLSDLLQTEWFSRKNPHDTKAYQHTSREKRTLMLREDIKKGRINGQIVDKLKSIPITIQDAFLKARINAVHDVGSGICVHNFVQTPCERHLQCSADCKDYVWVKDDKGRADDLKRQYSMTVVARETAEKKSKEKNSKRSIDWLTHNDKKIKTLSEQLTDNNIAKFDPHQYLEELSNE